MKYSVSARQPKATLKLADEIKVQYKDNDYIFNLVEWFPDKRIVIEIPVDEDPETIPWEIFQAHNEKLNGNLYICLYDYEFIKKCKEYELKYYWGIPLHTMYELRAVKNLGVSFAIIGAPLAFNLEAAYKQGIKLRMIPNMGFIDHIPRVDGIHGAWVRPEDVDLYDAYVDTFEFMTRGLQHERGLLNVYQSGYWNDDLSLLITGLNVKVPNYMINEANFTLRRLNCKQRCENGGACHACESYFHFVNSATNYLNYKKEKLNHS